jgi:DNA-binding beta-propeller fold protein YncE
VYVCDRENNRIQVFQKDGKFVKEAVISKNTLGEGGVWDIAFSRDPQQRFMYVANAQDKKVHVVLRESLQVLTAFGRGGRYPGQFSAVSNVAVDSKGNVYTGETYQGKRVQKFVFKGLAAVPSQNR